MHAMRYAFHWELMESRENVNCENNEKRGKKSEQKTYTGCTFAVKNWRDEVENNKKKKQKARML